jgi:malonate-semialdehyde dehydrogenase (acetylating)/methylmalonate-semialdehyde dehydrogenase
MYLGIKASAIKIWNSGKVITNRWLDPSHGGINLGFPQND